jgi:hypothetical protein
LEQGLVKTENYLLTVEGAQTMISTKTRKMLGEHQPQFKESAEFKHLSLMEEPTKLR